MLFLNFHSASVEDSVLEFLCYTLVSLWSVSDTPAHSQVCPTLLLVFLDQDYKNTWLKLGKDHGFIIYLRMTHLISKIFPKIND